MKTARAQRTKKIPGPRNMVAPNKMNPKRFTPRNIIIQISKFKVKILKAARKKQIITYKTTPSNCQLVFSFEILQARRE